MGNLEDEIHKLENEIKEMQKLLNEHFNEMAVLFEELHKDY